MEQLLEEFNKGLYIQGYNEDYQDKITHTKVFNEFLSKFRQLDINDVLDYLRQAGMLSRIEAAANGVDSQLLYGSYLHGVHHNIRVLVWTTYLANCLNLALEDLSLLETAALYHDMGRINDDFDPAHGPRSAVKIESLELEEKFNLPLLQAVIELHSIDDENLSKIASKYRIDDTKHLKQLMSVLKDADALDRVRLSYGQGITYSDLDPRMLRLKESFHLIKATHQLNEYYEVNVHERERGR